MSTTLRVWRGALYGRVITLVSLLVLAPIVLAVSVRDHSRTPAELLQLTGVVTYALMLGSAVLVYFHWRTGAEGGDRRLTGWLVVGLVVYATHGLIQSCVLIGSEPGAGADRWPLFSQLSITWLLVVLTHLSGHFEVRRDPALTAAAGSAVLSALYVGGAEVAPVHLSPLIAMLLNTLVMLGGLLLAFGVVVRADIPRSMRYHLAVAAIALTASQCVVNLRGQHRLFDSLAVVASVLGTVALCSMTQRLLHRTVTRHQSEVQALLAALAEMRAGVRQDRELLHEMTSTIAGITTASAVIRNGLEMNPSGRERLERMLEAELARLGRLSSERAGVARRPDHVAVDEVVEPIVVSHWLRGRDVRWAPSDVRTEACPDDVAAVVNILLENAHRHAPGATVTLSVRQVHDSVEITCSDEGPGVDADLRDQIFLSGVRGPDSPGEGLGLAMAVRVLQQSGGTLELAQTQDPGARFIARFPHYEGVPSHRDHVAS